MIMKRCFLPVAANRDVVLDFYQKGIGTFIFSLVQLISATGAKMYNVCYLVALITTGEIWVAPYSFHPVYFILC